LKGGRCVAHRREGVRKISDRVAEAFAGGSDAFVTKLNPAGSGLLYSTYLGGSGSYDLGSGIAVDAAGDAFVTGVTNSTNFPTTAGAFQTTLAGENDAFVTKLALVTFAGTPGYSNCQGQSVVGLIQQYGGIRDAANALGYSSVTALQTAIGAFCRA
jgi:Beta-propeller repeat